MSARPVVIIGVLVLYCFWFPQKVSASRSLTITADKTLLLGDEECHVTASASGFTDGETIYVKGAFFQSGSSNYFGYTKDGDTWIKNSASNISQRAVKIGEWDGTMTVKSDFSDSGYKGEGDYSFKVGFYVGSSSVVWSGNILTITVNEPDPTATLTPTSTNTPTLTPVPTTRTEPTATPIPTKIPTATCTSMPMRLPSDEQGMDEEIETEEEQAMVGGEVLGSSSAAILSSSVWDGEKPRIMALAVAAIGLATAAIIFVIRNTIYADTG